MANADDTSHQTHGTCSTSNADEAAPLLLNRHFSTPSPMSVQSEQRRGAVQSPQPPELCQVPVSRASVNFTPDDNQGDRDGGPAAAASHSLLTAQLCLCGAHALARWGWRTWEFAVALILIELFPSSLLLVSIYGVLDNIVRLAFGSVIGQYVDRTERLQGALTCYGIQNICIGASAAAAAVLVLLNTSEQGHLLNRHPVLYWTLCSATLLAGASSSVGSLGAAVAVEREYAKTLCGEDSAALRKLNAGLRAIDLLSQMLGPVASGLIMSYSSMLAAIVVLSCYSLAAWVPEALLLQTAHTHAPQLRQAKPHSPSCLPLRRNALHHLLGTAGWKVYFRQSTVLAGVSLALLYFTVLSLGFLMTSFLAWQGLSEATISMFRSAGALSGLLATVVFHPLQRCDVSLVGAGVLGVSWQLVALLAGVVPVVLAQALSVPYASTHTTTTPSGPTVGVTMDQVDAAAQNFLSQGPHSTLPTPLLYILLVGLVASRFGLWLFDLAVSQLQQEHVPEAELGTVSGVQASLQSSFEIGSFIAGTILRSPKDFHWLMAGSCAAVATAAATFYAFASRVGKGRAVYKTSVQEYDR